MQNIVLIVADTLSAYHLPLYGYDRDTAPFLTKLGREGWYALNGYSHAPFTVPSHASLFTGELPVDHRCTAESMYLSECALPQQLQKQGYTTLCITNQSSISPEFGFDGWNRRRIIQPSDRFQDRPGLAKYVSERSTSRNRPNVTNAYNFLRAIVAERDFLSLSKYIQHLVGYSRGTIFPDSGARTTLEKAQSWMHSTEKPFLLFLNFVEPHLDYDPPQSSLECFVEDPLETRSQFFQPPKFNAGRNWRWKELDDETIAAATDLYDASIRYLDDQLRRLHEWIRSELPDTTVIVVSDHGEIIDGPVRGHMCSIWDRSIRIPIIIDEPGRKGFETDPIGLRQLYEYILGRANLADLDGGQVFAEYYSLWSLMKAIGREQDLELYQEASEIDPRPYIMNRSKAIVDGSYGAVLNSHLENIAFKANLTDQDGSSSTPTEQTEELWSKLYDRFETPAWLDIDL